LNNINEILNKSQVAVFAKDLRVLTNSVEFYVPQKDHPFFDSISNAKIPMKNGSKLIIFHKIQNLLFIFPKLYIKKNNILLILFRTRLTEPQFTK
jgi:hypothetical protein